MIGCTQPRSLLRYVAPILQPVEENMPTVQVMRYRHGFRHVYRHIAGEHLLIATTEYGDTPLHGLTESGAELWRALDAWTTRDGLVDRLIATYEVSADEASADVDAFLEQLQALRALETEDEA
jgi:hypothetical protein